MKSVQEKGDIEGKLDSIKGIHKNNKKIYILRGKMEKGKEGDNERERERKTQVY